MSISTLRLASFFSSSTREKGTNIAVSSCPACTFSMRVLSSGTEIHSTPSSFTRSACQKFGFFSRMTRSPRRHSLTVNAPDDAVGNSAKASSPASTAFFDSTETFGSASVDRKGADGVFSLTVSVFGSVASAVSTIL